MNELVRKISNLTDAYCDRHYTDFNKITDYNDFWKQKFAELIVRECARVSERTGSLNEADYEGEMIADAIKEHFGVAE